MPAPWRMAAAPATCGEANEVPVAPRSRRLRSDHRCSTTVIPPLLLPAATATRSGFFRPPGDGPWLEKVAIVSSDVVVGLLTLMPPAQITSNATQLSVMRPAPPASTPSFPDGSLKLTPY